MRLTSLGPVALLVSLALLSGCFRDPNVRKQKYLESGQRYSAEGKDREAAIQYSNALRIDKNFAEAHYALAQTYSHMGSFSLAYGELLRTVDLAPTNYKARIDLGNLLLAAGKIDEAAAQASAVMAVQPDNADLHALLARIASKRGQKDLALAEIRRALELAPNEAALHETLALLEAGDTSQGSAVEAELKKSVELDPKSVGPKLLLSAFYIKESRWADAEQASRNAVATDAKNVSARESLAQVFLKQGDESKAVEVFRQASVDLADNPLAVRMLADYYSESGQFDKARAEFAGISAKYPKNVNLQEGYVRALLQVKDYATAQTVMAGLMKSNARDPQVEALNGVLLLMNGKTGDALSALRNSVSSSPKDAFSQYWLGKAALAEGDPSLAEKSFRQAAQLSPADLNAEGELARIASQRGDMNLLNEVGEKTIAAAPRSPAGYVWRATMELNHNANDKAETDLKTAMSVAPQSPDAYLLLGQIRFAQKKYPEGAALLGQALQYDPDSVGALRGLVAYDLFRRQPDLALARINAQIGKSPKDSNLYDLLAEFQVQSKNLDQATATAQKAMQINPDDGNAVALYAKLQVERGQTPNAITAWEQFSQSHPSNASALAVLGVLEEARGDTGKAKAYYRKALQIQPRQPVATNNLAYLMLETGENIDVALTLAQTARQAMPNSPTTADTLAWAYYHNGTYGFARDLLEDAVRIEPNSAAMQYHLGMVYSKLKDKNDAATHLRKAVSLAPDSPTGKDAQKALQGLS
jgi:tetratricopeptide (TPR) repeat protein